MGWQTMGTPEDSLMPSEHRVPLGGQGSVRGILTLTGRDLVRDLFRKWRSKIHLKPLVLAASTLHCAVFLSSSGRLGSSPARLVCLIRAFFSKGSRLE